MATMTINIFKQKHRYTSKAIANACDVREATVSAWLSRRVLVDFNAKTRVLTVYSDAKATGEME